MLSVLVNGLTGDFLVKMSTGTSLLRLNKDYMVRPNKGFLVKGLTGEFLVKASTREFLVKALRFIKDLSEGLWEVRTR